jgi:hypothetical protein
MIKINSIALPKVVHVAAIFSTAREALGFE